MSAAFLIPFVVLLAVSVICGKALGFWWRGAYFALWLGGFVVVGVLEFSPFVFGAFQCSLAIIMLFHARIVAKKEDARGVSS